jgi:glutamine amidotransferase
MIAIVDYGLGNIKAFSNVYKKLDISHCIARVPADLEGASKIILPGVGAFDHAMTLLNQSGMRETLDACVLDRKVPVMGICVGMQILAHSSEEGVLPGLGWIDGVVKKLVLENRENQRLLPLPHMGWNQVLPKKEHPLFSGMKDPAFYFLHSYYLSCRSDDDILAEVEYGGRFTSVVQSGNVIGVQCHPEKSHHSGIQLLSNFARLEF